MRAALLLVAFVAVAIAAEGAWKCSLATAGLIPNSECFPKAGDFAAAFSVDTDGSQLNVGTLTLRYDETAVWLGSFDFFNLKPSTQYFLFSATEGTCSHQAMIHNFETDSNGRATGDFEHAFVEENFDFNMLRLSTEESTFCENLQSAKVEGLELDDIVASQGSIKPLEPFNFLGTDFVYAEDSDNFMTTVVNTHPKRSQNHCPWLKGPAWVYINSKTNVLTHFEDGKVLEGTNCIQAANARTGCPLWQYWNWGHWYNGAEIDKMFPEYGNNIDKTMGDALFYTSTVGDHKCAIQHRLGSLEQIHKFLKKTGGHHHAFLRLTVAQGNGRTCDIDLIVKLNELRAGEGDQIFQKDDAADPIAAILASIGLVALVAVVAVVVYRRRSTSAEYAALLK